MNFATRTILPLFIHPLFVLVISAIIGIAFQFIYSPHIAISILALFTGMFIFLYSFYVSKHSVFIFCVLLGFSCGALRLHQQTTLQAELIKMLCNKKMDFEGEITDMQISHSKQQKHRITLSVSRYHLENDSNPEWLQANASVFIYTRNNLTEYKVGDTIKLENTELKHSENNPSFNNYLLKEGIIATVFLHNATIQPVKQRGNGVSSWLYTQKNKLLNRLRNRFTHPTFALFTSLFLGNRAEEKKEQDTIAQQSKNWGTSHHLARSGLHLVIFIYLLHSLLRFLPISLFAKEFLLLFLCIIYYLFTWSSISFIRAFITFLFYKVCTILQFPSHVLHVLTLASGLVLFSNPMQLFFLDFQLSFGLTFTLAWFNAAYQATRAH